MISREGVQKGQHAMPCRGIHNLIYVGQREAIFWTGIVEVSVVDTYSPFVLLFRDHHYIGQPLGIFHYPDKSIMKKVINFSLDDQVAIRVKTSHFLSTGLAEGAIFSLCEAWTGLIPGISA